jgi:hypothetical protein
MAALNSQMDTTGARCASSCASNSRSSSRDCGSVIQPCNGRCRILSFKALVATPVVLQLPKASCACCALHLRTCLHPPPHTHTHPQVCREAYPPVVCYLLWVLAEISIVALDLTMVLGEWVGGAGEGSVMSELVLGESVVWGCWGGGRHMMMAQ